MVDPKTESIVEAYELLKDIVNADDNGQPYKGCELQNIALPIINRLGRLLPDSHEDYPHTRGS